MNMEKLFEVVYHMQQNSRRPTAYTLKGEKGEDIILEPEVQGEFVRRSMQAFIQGDAYGGYQHEGKIIPIQAFSGSSDLPQLTKDVFNVTNTVPNFDTLWQSSFKSIQLMRGQLQWEIADVESGITFELVPEGDKCKIYSFSGNKQIVGIEKYGAGTGVTWEMIEGRKLYQFIDQVGQTRANLFLLWANVHYGLLATAAALTAVAWQGVATDPVVSRDIATINTGYTTIGDATKDKGYGDTANAEMILYASPLLKARIMQALRATSNDQIGGRRDGAAGSRDGEIVEYNVTPRFSWNANIPANKALMVLPGNKIQNSAYMQELSLSEKDITTLNEIRTYWSAFGAVVADTDQTAELAFA
jgi:hypothetical protein